MAILAATAPSRPPLPLSADGSYEPGVCNIGPAEIARRRRTGHTGVITSVGLVAFLVLLDAPSPFRMLVFFPAAVAAAGYLQAWLRFCAGFGWLGVFNFDEVGTAETVASAEARKRDRIMAIRIGIACALVGGIAAVIAVALPL